MFTEGFKITTGMLWQGVLLFALIDAGIMFVLVQRVSAELFRQIKWMLAVVAGITWFSIWTWAVRNFWETVYSYVFPAWARSVIPLGFGLLMALVALGIWTLARWSKINLVIVYALFGGFWGVLTHLWAVSMGIVTKPPMLQDASPVAAVVVSFFEYIFYWGVILSLSALLHWGWVSVQSDL